MSKLIVVARFSFPHEPHIAKGLLESEEIPAFVADEHRLICSGFIQMQWEG